MIYYYLFIRKIYKRNKDFSSNVSSCVTGCLLLNVLFISGMIEYVTGMHVVDRVFKFGIPLGPLAGVIYFILMLVYYRFRKTKELDSERINKIRIAYSKVNKIHKAYAILYLIFSILMLPAYIYLRILMS